MRVSVEGAALLIGRFIVIGTTGSTGISGTVAAALPSLPKRFRTMGGRALPMHPENADSPRRGNLG
jgi:hypothetical protein